MLADRAVDRKWLVALPVLAALTVPLSFANTQGHGWVVLQGLFLVAAAIAVPRDRPHRPPGATGAWVGAAPSPAAPAGGLDENENVF